MSLLADAKRFIAKPGCVFRGNTFSASDIDVPVDLGNGNVVFPERSTFQQRMDWRAMMEIDGADLKL